MIQAVNLRSGMTYLDGDNLMRVISAEHHKPGKGNTVMRMQIRNVRTGSTTSTTYRPDQRFESAFLEKKEAQYLYRQDDSAVFMDNETYEQYEIPVNFIDNELLYIKENDNVEIEFYGSEVIGVQLPPSVTLTVAETEPSIKGATVASSGKPAKMETGLVVTVPDFIEVGQAVVISTADGSYSRRA